MAYQIAAQVCRGSRVEEAYSGLVGGAAVPREPGSINADQSMKKLVSKDHVISYLSSMKTRDSLAGALVSRLRIALQIYGVTEVLGLAFWVRVCPSLASLPERSQSIISLLADGLLYNLVHLSPDPLLVECLQGIAEGAAHVWCTQKGYAHVVFRVFFVLPLQSYVL